MLLSQFAPDVLQQVCEFLDGQAIGFLWLSGNRLLNYKLAKTCVTRFAHTFESYRPITWPKLISNLQRLEMLSLTCTYPIPIEHVDLYDIPSSVTDLTFEFANSDLAWVDWQPRGDSVTDSGAQSSSSAKIFPISKRLPHLRHLLLLNASLPPGILAHLPQESGLQTLWLPQMNGDIDLHTLWQYCPKSVTSLKLNSLKIQEVGSGHWFWPELKTLHVRNLSGAKSAPISGFPSSLTDFAFHSLGLDGGKLQPHELLKTLPLPEMRRLSFQTLSNDFRGAFPPQLRHLELGHSFGLSHDAVEQLPTQLEALGGVIILDQKCRKSTLLHLPKTLTSLSVCLFDTTPASPLQLSQLPLLKKLNISYTYSPGVTLPGWNAVLACRHLTSLNTSTLDVDSDMPLLPTGLLELTVITLDVPKVQWALFPCLKELCVGADYILNPPLHTRDISALPGSLESFTYFGTVIVEDGWQGPPPLLRKLKISRGGQRHGPSVADLTFFQHLPSVLIKLSFDHPCTITDDFFPLLPRYLQVLNIVCAAESRVSDASFALLPRGLYRLSIIGQHFLVSNTILSHLPRTLINLTLPSSVELTEAACKQLPSHLRELRIDVPQLQKEITDCLSELPLYVSIRSFHSTGPWAWKNPAKPQEAARQHLARLLAESTPTQNS